MTGEGLAIRAHAVRYWRPYSSVHRWAIFDGTMAVMIACGRPDFDAETGLCPEHAISPAGHRSLPQLESTLCRRIVQTALDRLGQANEGWRIKSRPEVIEGAPLHYAPTMNCQ
jgi:hypothetical protein